MAGMIRVSSDLDAKGFLSGVDDMSEALEDVSKDIKDTSKDGDKALEKLEDSFAEAAKAAKEAGNDVGRNMKKGFKEAEGGSKELKENAASNAKEVAASFDGSVESIVDGFQGLAAEAFEGWGPAGIAAGVAVGAGIGLATAEFQKTQEAAQKAKERIAEFGLATIESGIEVASLEKFDEALKLIVTNSDDAAVKLQDLEKFTKKYGNAVPSVEDMAMAYAGNADAIESTVSKLEDAIQAEKDHVYTGKVAQEQSDKRIRAYQSEIDAIKKVGEETAAIQAIQEAYAESQGNAAATQLESIQGINQAYDEAVTSVDAFYNAETKILDVEGYAASIAERERLLQEYQTNLAKSGLTDEQISALNQMGVEQANALLKGLQDPSVAQATKDTITRGLSNSASDASGVAKGKIEEAFKKPTEAKVKAIADTASARQDLDNLIKARTAIIKLDFQDIYGKRVY